MHHVSTTYVQIRNSSIISYAVHESSQRLFSPNPFMVNESGEIAKSYSGTTNANNTRRIRIATDLLLQCTVKVRLYNPIIQKEVDHKLSFITLTLSMNNRFISAKECYKNCLKPFLQYLTRTEKAKYYIWKAERQKPYTKDGKFKLSNGQLHYHITTDAFILYSDLQNKWNYLQEKAGYLDEFIDAFHHNNAPSVDIHEVYNLDNLEGYLMKYISKEQELLPPESIENYEDRKKVDGKIWDCSSNLRGKKFFKLERTDKMHADLKLLSSTDNVKYFENDYVRMYFFKEGKPQDLLTPVERNCYKKFKSDIDNNIKQTEIISSLSCSLYEGYLESLVIWQKEAEIKANKKPPPIIRNKINYNSKKETIKFINNNTLNYEYDS